MCEIKWVEHGIDFLVILFADLGAAYFAIKFFEASHADRERTENSLSVLYKLITRMQIFITKSHEAISPDDNVEARISSDLTDNDNVFEDIRDDFLFWNFKKVKIFREHYNKVQLQKQAIHRIRFAGDLRTKVKLLIDQLDSFKKDIEDELKRKKPWWKFWT